MSNNPRARCPRCASTRSWALKNGRRRCARCRYDWRPGQLPLRLNRAEWQALLEWFVRGVPSAAIAREANLGRKRVLRALKVLRLRILRTAPDGFGAPGASVSRAPENARRRTAVIGLFVDRDRVWAEIVPGVNGSLFAQLPGQAQTLLPAARPDLAQYSGVIYRRRLHRVSPEPRNGTPFGPLEAFWSYLQRQLRSRGGIRLARLNLYLAEYSWRYNHRAATPATQLEELMELLEQSSAPRGTMPDDNRPHV
jgi:transposase